MGEIEGTYRVLQTPGTRLGAQTPAGVSTLEPGQTLSGGATRASARMQEKHLHIRVKLLDNTVEIFDVEPKRDGQALLMQVWRHLNLTECDYFGLEFQHPRSYWIWLEPMKPIIRQVRRPKNTLLRLAVKFFPPDPGQLQEEFTRYLFALQLKRDLLEERLPCADTTAALLASHLLQSEIGDYDETLDREHLKANEYLPSQERALEKILEFHRKHTGQTPAESDFQVLEIARKLEMYGVRLHAASDREGARIHLAVSHMGVLVFQGTTKINTFNWSRVRKLSFKRKRFLIKLHPEVRGPYQDTLEFLLGSRDECKNFWKICVEYHTFFRLFDQPKAKAKAVFFSRGSSFRYSGRTQKQLVDYVRDSGVKRVPYERRHSKTRVSLRALTADLPRQSISFTEGMRTSASPSSTNASFYSVPTSPLAPRGPCDFKDSSGSLTEPQAPDAKRPAAERSGGAAADSDARRAQSPGPPAPQPCQGLSTESPQPSPSTRKSPPSLSPVSRVTLGLARQGSSPLLSPALSDAGGVRTDGEEEPRHKAAPRRAPRRAPGRDQGAGFPTPGDQRGWNIGLQAAVTRRRRSPCVDGVPEQRAGHWQMGEHVGLRGPPEGAAHEGSRGWDRAGELRRRRGGAAKAQELQHRLTFAWRFLQKEERRAPGTRGGAAASAGPAPQGAHKIFLKKITRRNLARRLRPGSCFYSEGNASGLGESGWGGGTRGRSRLCFLQGPAADEAYFIAKEMLATERTYLKDLEVLTVWFRSAVLGEDAMPADLMTLLFSNIDPIYEFHRRFLRELEQRLAPWEGSSHTRATAGHQRIGDILRRNMHQLKDLTSCFQRHDEVLSELEKAARRGGKLAAACRAFERQRVCYLPLGAFLLKPAQRLLHYRLLLGRLCPLLAPAHPDSADCRDALQAITEVTSALQHSLARLENLQKLTELQRDLVGIDNLVTPGREFIREGCLHKLTKKGLQQRMFFLFSDVLLYTSRGVTGTSRFRIRGRLPLRGMLLIVLDPPVEEGERERSVPHCFTICAAQKTIVVAASTRLEKEKWMRDLNDAIDAAKSGSDLSLMLPGSVPCAPPYRSSEAASLEQEAEEAGGPHGSLEGQGQRRANTTVHVCWYRNTSVSRADHSVAVENQLSGYLLRKFKNSSGWQKLWVVFTNFCLFFYKTHQDDHPLASLPLLGYSVSVPEEADGVHKEHVFKLQFKSHVYFFRAESKYTFERWMEVIERASSSPARAGPSEAAA